MYGDIDTSNGNSDNIDWFHHYELLCYNGGYETFHSWIEEGENKNWISYIRDLPTYMTYENVCGQTIHLSHAGFNYYEDDTIPAPKQLLWDRKHIKYQDMFGPVSNETNIIYEEKNLINEEFIVEITTELSYQVSNIIFEDKGIECNSYNITNNTIILNLTCITNSHLSCIKIQIIYRGLSSCIR